MIFWIRISICTIEESGALLLNHQILHINTLTPNILPVITSLNIPCGFLLKRKSFYLLCPALDTAYVSMFQIELGMIGTCYNGRED